MIELHANKEEKMKKSISRRVEKLDSKKKVNPLDLSSDQDLTVALMNLIAIEDMCGENDLQNMIGEMRHSLMRRIVNDDKLMAASVKLLGGAMKLIDDGCELMANGHRTAAYNNFDRAYEMYSLFWGINMGMMDVDDIN